MKVNNMLKGDIYGVNFGYNSKVEVYPKSMLYIPELYIIDRLKWSNFWVIGNWIKQPFNKEV